MFQVYGRGSSSRSWLEKHVVANHGDNKPFQCIVDGCRQRFGTQMLLERHVNNHFKVSNGNNGQAAKKQPIMCSSSDSPHHHQNGSKAETHMAKSSTIKKLILANGKRLKFRKARATVYSSAGRVFDLFDLGVMDQVRQRLTSMESGFGTLRSNGSRLSSEA